MNAVMKKQIISELDSLADTKAGSLLDYLHFLKQEQNEHYPNAETMKAIKEADAERADLKSYSSAEAMFEDLGILD